MTFLVDADLPRSAADVVRRHGYDAVDVRDIGLRHADDSEIASHAQHRQQCLLTGDFDFVFVDAWKRDYKRFFDVLFPRLRPHGLFLAHNVVNKQGEMRDFLAAIHTHPAAMTTIVSPSVEGMSVTYKIEGRR